MKTSGRSAVSRETSLSSGSLKLCRAGIEMGGLPFTEMLKPKRGGFVEAWSRGQRGENLEEGQR
jgi:hypothetical protein